MKNKFVIAMLILSMSTAMVGCGSSASEGTTTETATETTTDSEDTTDTEDSVDTQIANPWTETDATGILNATGFLMSAPSGASNVTYSYLEEDGLAQMSYELDDADWTYRMQATEKLSDISGMNYSWDLEDEGEVSGMAANYYGYAGDDEMVQLVCWYDALTGIDYSLSATGTDLDGMDMQAYAESIYTSMQGEATDDPTGDAENELKEYFLGEHTKSDDGSTLTIADNGDGTFDIAISITRLASMEGGVGTFAEHKMTFEIEDPSENTLKGMIYRDSDNSLVIRITDSTWDYLPNGEELSGFGK